MGSKYNVKNYKEQLKEKKPPRKPRVDKLVVRKIHHWNGELKGDHLLIIKAQQKLDYVVVEDNKLTIKNVDDLQDNVLFISTEVMDINPALNYTLEEQKSKEANYKLLPRVLKKHLNRSGLQVTDIYEYLEKVEIIRYINTDRFIITDLGMKYCRFVKRNKAYNLMFIPQVLNYLRYYIRLNNLYKRKGV